MVTVRRKSGRLKAMKTGCWGKVREISDGLTARDRFVGNSE